MESLLSGMSQHGYLMLFVAVFLESIGFPVPAALALLFAGGASARGPLHIQFALGSALSAMLLGDTLMYLLGRFTGWWLLGLLCRLSLNPESCVVRSADSFYRRGRTVLVFAKFLPGINTMAAPLAGSMNMRYLQFVGLDSMGVSLYVGAYLGAGFVFSNVLARITSGLQAFGRIVSWMIVALIATYIAYQIHLWVNSLESRGVPRVPPPEVARRLHEQSGNVVIYDVRSHGYYERGATRIQPSSRLDPNALQQMAQNLPRDKEIFVYCTCVKQATSMRVAYELRQQGLQCSVIDGGLRAWKQAGLPVEPVPIEDTLSLPTFARQVPLYRSR